MIETTMIRRTPACAAELLQVPRRRGEEVGRDLLFGRGAAGRIDERLDAAQDLSQTFAGDDVDSGRAGDSRRSRLSEERKSEGEDTLSAKTWQLRSPSPWRPPGSRARALGGRLRLGLKEQRPPPWRRDDQMSFDGGLAFYCPKVRWRPTTRSSACRELLSSCRQSKGGRPPANAGSSAGRCGETSVSELQRRAVSPEQ